MFIHIYMQSMPNLVDWAEDTEGGGPHVHAIY